MKVVVRTNETIVGEMAIPGLDVKPASVANIGITIDTTAEIVVYDIDLIEIHAGHSVVGGPLVLPYRGEGPQPPIAWDGDPDVLAPCVAGAMIVRISPFKQARVGVGVRVRG